MSLRIHTARVSYAGRDRLDISRKSGCPVGVLFAPSGGLLSRVLTERENYGRVCDETWRRYQISYREEMLASRRAYRPEWDALLARTEVTLCCYCSREGGGLRCHRVLLAGYLVKLGARYLGEREGEQISFRM